MDDLTRRRFVGTLGAAGAGALAPGLLSPKRRALGPLIRDGAAVRPVAISSANGLRATAHALAAIEGGSDTLEAVVGGVNIVEGDPADQTVGYGGLPNAAGVVQLDSQVHHGPTRGVGAVAALEGFRHPSRVAMAVMRFTDHVLLVAEGAARFASEMGFAREDLLTPAAREEWLRWRAGASAEDDYLSPEESGEPVAGFTDPGGTASGPEDRPLAPVDMLDSHDGERPMGTIHCSAVDRAGNLSAVTTTSGLFFKVPGRVGDSALPGAGCHCDNEVGAAGSTGRGEAVIKTAGSFLVVEEMRRGAHPTDACLTALRRIVTWTVEARLLNEDGRPNFNVSYYAVNKRGEAGAATLWSGRQYALHDGSENRLLDGAYLFE